MNTKPKLLFFIFVVLFFGIQSLKAQQLEQTRLVITHGINDENLRRTIEQNVSEFLTACNRAVMRGGRPNLNRQGITSSGRSRFLAIWDSSPIGISVSTLERNGLTRPAGGFQIRNIPVTMFNAPEEFREQEIVINLTADGRIDDVFIPVTQYTELLRADIEEEDINMRLTVLEFVENFRTAFNRKDIDFIETLFCDNAVIIVGKVLRRVGNNRDVSRSNNIFSNEQFEFTTRTKREYINALRGVFRRNRFINVQFDDIRIVRHPNPQFPVYGVTLKQDWCAGQSIHCEPGSPNYMDTGWVFLLIDFSLLEHPVITIRTWQPDKIHGRDLRQDEIFNMGDFIR